MTGGRAVLIVAAVVSAVLLWGVLTGGPEKVRVPDPMPVPMQVTTVTDYSAFAQ